jgi:hypothetical protein
MQWPEIQSAYPEQWLVIEALAAHTEGERRHLDQIAVVETCAGGAAALQRYRQLHLEYPQRDLYFVHTSRHALDIHERQWLGIRRSHAASAA